MPYGQLAGFSVRELAGGRFADDPLAASLQYAVTLASAAALERASSRFFSSCSFFACTHMYTLTGTYASSSLADSRIPWRSITSAAHSHGVL